MSGASPVGSPAPFAGRTALVTGGGRGLGRAVARALAASGARVLVVGRTDADLRAVVAEVTAGGGSAGAERCDVSSPGQVDRLAARLDRETISILVNNAGIAGPVAALVDVAAADWDEVFAANVRSVYLMCRAFVPPMVARGAGDVITMASVSAKRPLAGRSPYTASKAAVLGLTMTLAAEVGPAGVTVNSLSPGPVRGPRMSRNFAAEAARTGVSVAAAERAFTARGSLGRLVEEREVGAAVVAMLQMPGLHGADIDLSAGMVAR